MLPWEFFENYSGSVYVTEVETNRLVYMNKHLRNSIGFGSGREYQGLLCHEVLQGKKKPCEFCTNHKLKPGESVSWSYQNPFLKKSYVLHDTLVHYAGKPYRLEIAMDQDADDDSRLYYARSDQILGECLRQMFATADETLALNTLLQYIGETFGCDRVYIFEVAEHRDRVNNTYEWCAKGVKPQKQFLQNVPYESVSFWFDIFDREGVLSIENLEDIRERYPLTYAYLQPQDIRSLLVGPIQETEGYIGFIGADNPKKISAAILSQLVRVIGYFIAVLINRRDLIRRFWKQSHNDPLTGALNQNSLMEFFSGAQNAQSLGFVYCDISGLHHVNERSGHAAGNQLIVQSYRLISAMMEEGTTYRIGGDEFAVVCADLPQADFLRQVEELRKKIAAGPHHIAVGSAWTDELPVPLEELQRKAEQEMYRDKQRRFDSGAADAGDRGLLQEQKDLLILEKKDLERAFPAWLAADTTTCTCMGDCRNQYYYVSKGMRKVFGFPGMIVRDFMSQWEERIIGQEQKQMFRKHLEQILQEKQSTVDFSYTMQDCEGNVVLVRCLGIIEWDKTYTTPLVFIGNAHVEEARCMTDPITALPSTQSAAETLGQLPGPATVFLFKLNHFGKINESKGRSVGNQLLKNIAADLQFTFGDSASFFRLEGMKFMAVLSGGCPQQQDVADEIRNIVNRHYKNLEITAAEPLILLPVRYSNQNEHPLDLLRNVPALLASAEFHAVSHAIEDSSTYLSALRQEIDMEFALNNDILNNMANFRIVVQPLVSAKTGKILGGEVLLRWMFQGTDISPGVFIPIIERENLMGIAGKWVMDQTVQCCRNLSVYRPDMYLSFNVSYHQIMGSDFAKAIETALKKYELDGTRIVAELTETHADKAPVRLKAFIDSCEKMGVRIALDDFGNGYSSLGLLLKCSAQVIKMDRSILREMVASEEKESLVGSLVEACHKMGKQVCIEGVETEKDLAVAVEAGCDIIQGFYYYRPLELSDFYRKIAQ